MLIRRKIFGCPETRIGCEYTDVDSVAFEEPGAAETVFLAEIYDLTIETGILLFEAVDLDFHDLTQTQMLVVCYLRLLISSLRLSICECR